MVWVSKRASLWHHLIAKVWVRHYEGNRFDGQTGTDAVRFKRKTLVLSNRRKCLNWQLGIPVVPFRCKRIVLHSIKEMAWLGKRASVWCHRIAEALYLQYKSFNGQAGIDVVPSDCKSDGFQLASKSRCDTIWEQTCWCYRIRAMILRWFQ